MIEQALYQHLIAQPTLTRYLTRYNGLPAVFNQEAPADTDGLWMAAAQYGRIVFTEDLQGDPERIMGGTLVVDVQCKEGDQFPEVLEPIVRNFIHGYFFSSGIFTVEAQWKNSSYFTQPTDKVVGCTITFDLLAFPMLTTQNPDVIERINQWTADAFSGISVINLAPLPSSAWKPTAESSAVYWRVQNDAPAQWIPDTFATIWRTATIKGHVFSVDVTTATALAQEIATKLHVVKRIVRPGETQIMTNRRNSVEVGADPLRTGQITVEATYGVIAYIEPDNLMNNAYYQEEGDALWQATRA